MRLSHIVAKTENNVIGGDNQLLWHLPADLQHFKRTTLGRHVIMGRKTIASINKPLPGRSLIIVTRDPPSQAVGCKVAHDIPAALDMARQSGETELFIAGGGEIYRATLPLVDKIYLTEVKTVLRGDTFFPMLVPSEWTEIKRIAHPVDEKHAYACDFVELVRSV